MKEAAPKDYYLGALAVAGCKDIMTDRQRLVYHMGTVSKPGTDAPTGSGIQSSRNNELEAPPLVCPDESILSQIGLDITRTCPTHPFFQSEPGLMTLKRLLVGCAVYHPSFGYTQSMNFLAAFLLLVRRANGVGQPVPTVKQAKESNAQAMKLKSAGGSTRGTIGGGTIGGGPTSVGADVSAIIATEAGEAECSDKNTAQESILPVMDADTVTGDYEEECFWVLVATVDRFKNYYNEGMRGLKKDTLILTSMVASFCPAMSKLFQEAFLELSFMTAPWFLCLYFTWVKPEVVARIWDLIHWAPKQQAAGVVLWVALGLLKISEEKILKEHMKEAAGSRRRHKRARSASAFPSAADKAAAALAAAASVSTSLPELVDCMKETARELTTFKQLQDAMASVGTVSAFMELYSVLCDDLSSATPITADSVRKTLAQVSNTEAGQSSPALGSPSANTRSATTTPSRSMRHWLTPGTGSKNKLPASSQKKRQSTLKKRRSQSETDENVYKGFAAPNFGDDCGSPKISVELEVLTPQVRRSKRARFAV
jgi:hypothetical protein